jgi:hypothetical protein
MDSFETVVSLLLRREGYWTYPCFKVELTKEEKHAIGRHTSPRWEIDLLAYKAGTNELLVVECKSYLDSTGVSFRDGEFATPERYKLFNESKLREIVLERLKQDLVIKKMCNPNPKGILCLATGKIANVTDRAGLQAHFDKNGWRLFSDKWIKERLEKASEAEYENDISLVVTKLLTR